MKKILFICTGNTCRSPMAEGFFNEFVNKDKDLAGRFYALSAGIAAYDGLPASANAITALQEGWGIDISGHRARLISQDLMENSYLIFTMTGEQKEYLHFTHPEFKNKIFTLKEFACDNIINKNKFENSHKLDISDPFGKDLEVYKKCAAEINEAVEKLVANLKNRIFDEEQ